MEILHDGDRRRQALDKIRRDREATLAEIESTAEARLTIDETVKRLLARLSADVARAEQRVLSFASPATMPDALAIDGGFLLWLDAQAFERQLRARLKPLLTNAGVPEAERSKTIAALRGRAAELEELEEIEISRLEAQGLAVDRRGDADLATLLRIWDGAEAAPA